MIELLDKLILYITCFLHLLYCEPLDICVSVCLIALIITCLCAYTSNTYLSCGLYLSYGVMILFFPIFLFMLPLISYDCLKPEHSFRERILCFSITIITFIYATAYLDVIPLIVIGILIVFANAISFKTNDTLKLKHTISRNRDAGRELQILLEQKNADLIEKSNYEIEMATLKERNRIAREIHDNVGHLLTRSILQVGALSTINTDSDLQPHLNSLSVTLNQAMDTIRSSVHNLYTPQDNLKKSLETFFKTITDLEIQMKFEAKQVPQSVAFHVLSIVKEAINNTLKHSDANRILIHFLEHPRFYQLVIEDNGTTACTCSPTELSHGMGLSSIQERIHSLRGTMEIFTESGFKIFITIMKET